MIAFYHDKDSDRLNVGCTLPNLANICLHKNTDAKFYPFTEGHTDLLVKKHRDVFGGPFIVFTRKAVVDEDSIRKSTYAISLLVLTLANYTSTQCVCLSMPTGLYTRWDLDLETGGLRTQQNKTRSFQNVVMSYFQRTRPTCKIEVFFTTGGQKKTDCLSVDGFCSHCKTVFEPMGCFHHFCLCQDLRPSPTEVDIQRGSEKKELHALRQHFLQEKDFNILELWDYERWRLCKTSNNVKQHIREHFRYKRSLAAEQILEEIKKRIFYGYLQYDIEVPENLRSNSHNFPPILRNTLVSKIDIGHLMINYAEEGRLFSLPGKRRYPVSVYDMEHLLLLCCCFIYNRVLFAQKLAFCWVNSKEMF